jgi:hypothetical protein
MARLKRSDTNQYHLWGYNTSTGQHLLMNWMGLLCLNTAVMHSIQGNDYAKQNEMDELFYVQAAD